MIPIFSKKDHKTIQTWSKILSWLKGWYRKLKQVLLITPSEFKYSKAQEFYQQPSIKYLSQGSKESRFNNGFPFRKGKPSYITNENFSSTLVNMLRQEVRGVHD
ncbi:MAG: hypothetical protein AAF696_37425, partial [Bacteroidota bacterium]